MSAHLLPVGGEEHSLRIRLRSALSRPPIGADILKAIKARRRATTGGAAPFDRKLAEAHPGWGL
jgi:hypothetical protein